MTTLFIIRGVSSSGKSTTTKHLALKYNFFGIKRYYPHFEADMFFYDKEGNYNFNHSKLGYAHKWCQNKVEESMILGHKKVFVSNTSTTEKEVNTYIKLAKQYDYTPIVLLNEKWHTNNNNHNVPVETIERMKKNLMNSIKL